MKILIISDSHGHIGNIRTVLEIAKKSNIEAVVHCGDWDNVESVKAVLDYELPLYAVSGNADVEDGLDDFLQFNATKFDPFLLKFELDGRRIAIIHKLKNDFVENIDSLDVVFNGHYHAKEMKIVNFVKFVRPGALLNGINFAVYETVTGEVDFINDGSS